MAVGLASNLELDRTNTSDRNLLLTCYSEDIAVEGREGLEPGFVNGNVDVGGRREYPIVAGRLSRSWLLALWSG